MEFDLENGNHLYFIFQTEQDSSTIFQKVTDPILFNTGDKTSSDGSEISIISKLSPFSTIGFSINFIDSEYILI